MFLIIFEDQHQMTTREILIYGRSHKTLSGVVLSNSKVFVVLRNMLSFGKTFELKHGISFS